MQAVFTRRPWQRLAVAAGLALLGASVQAQTTVEDLQSRGARIGYANEKPFAYTEMDGHVTGESPQIVAAILPALGIAKIEPVLTEWGALIPGLRAQRFDLIAAGMYITPERCKQVLFTDPHYQLPDTLLVAQGNPKNLDSYESIAADPSVKLAITSGTVNLKYARDAGISDDQIVQVPDTSSQLQAVLSGRADATIGTQLTMQGLEELSRGRAEALREFKDDPAHMGYGALAFRPEDRALRDAVNTALKQWLGSEAHLAAVAPFGFDERNITHKTAAELCQAE